MARFSTYATVALAFCVLVAADAFTAKKDDIGSADRVVNQVEGTYADSSNATVTKVVKSQDRLRANEVITTGPDSGTEISFIDETLFTIGPESSVVLDEFVYDPDPSKGRLAITATKGVFRFLSGKFASSAYEIKTPTATMGVRGTFFDVIVEEDGLTTVAVQEGEVELANFDGESILIPAGLSSTVKPAPPGEFQAPPSALAPPSEEFLERIAAMEDVFSGFFGMPDTEFRRFLAELDWSRIVAWAVAAVFMLPALTGGLSILALAGVLGAGGIVLWLLFF
ncbi:MAG: FecR domain-containing protein [Alphaproteobacteria bacterium]|nr:FecR domain-containing protein [Alphaproteobacteria bacterium]